MAVSGSKGITITATSNEDAVGKLRATLDGNPPPGVTVEPLDDFLARGRVEGCTCGMIVCVCAQVRGHKPDCRYVVAQKCPVSFECEHGLEVCPTCDACDCGAQ